MAEEKKCVNFVLLRFLWKSQLFIGIISYKFPLIISIRISGHFEKKKETYLYSLLDLYISIFLLLIGSWKISILIIHSNTNEYGDY